MRVIAVASQKGGVGKTATAVNLAVGLARRGGRRVLLVDVDPQGCAGAALGLEADSGPALADVLGRRATAEQAIATAHGIDVLPAGLDLARVEAQLFGAAARDERLARALEPVRRRYQVAVLDCPPSLGLLTLNALRATAEVLIPVQCEVLALRRVGPMLDTVAEVREFHRLRVAGIVPTLYDARTVHQRDVLAELREALGGRYHVCEPIPRSVRVAEASAAGEPVITYEPDNPASLAYLELAMELDKR